MFTNRKKYGINIVGNKKTKNEMKINENRTKIKKPQRVANEKKRKRKMRKLEEVKMKTTRMTKVIATMVVATMLMATGCNTKDTQEITTETVDITTYTVIDENEPTVTETIKNDDGTVTVITKTTDGTLVSKATTKETEGTTTTQETSKETSKVTTEPTTSKAEPTVTEPKVTTEPTTKATEPTATPTETTKPTDTPKPTETTKPTDAPKPTEPKPTETTKPTTQPTKPTTSPTTPEPKPTTPEPTETTPKPTETTPAPQKYEVYVQAQTGGTVTGGGYYKAGDKVTIKATANDGYHFTGWGWDAEGVTNATYTFTMPANDMSFNARFEKDAEVAPTKPMTYYATADFEVYVRYYDANGDYHENVLLTKSGITVYTTDGRLTGGHFNLYGYNNIRELVEQLFKEYDSSAIIEGYAGVQITNIRNERENP